MPYEKKRGDAWHENLVTRIHVFQVLRKNKVNICSVPEIDGKP
jgi:hypothetical protein